MYSSGPFDMSRRFSRFPNGSDKTRAFANPNLEGCNDHFAALGCERGYSGRHVVHQVMDIALSRNIAVIVKNDLGIAFRHSQRNRMLV
jgi:hypothetical protein